MTARIVPDYRALVAPLAVARSGGRAVALANGCFDLLHVGHVRLLAHARELADLVVVAVNQDASAHAIKGAGRPLVPLAERMEVMAALAGVDFVTSFPEETADALLSALRPEIHVKGGDWTEDTVPERDTVRAYGGRVAIAGDAKRHSTTALLDRLRASGADARASRREGSRGK